MQKELINGEVMPILRTQSEKLINTKGLSQAIKKAGVKIS